MYFKKILLSDEYTCVIFTITHAKDMNAFYLCITVKVQREYTLMILTTLK